MKQPQNSDAPDLSGHSKILFYNEGGTMAVLVENKLGVRSTVPKPFKTAEIALGWCRKNAVLMVYCPVNLEAN